MILPNINIREMTSTINAMEYSTTYFPRGGRLHGSIDRGGRGATPGISLKTLVFFTNGHVGAIALTIDSATAAIPAAMIPPQQIVMKKIPTCQLRFQRAHARSSLYEDIRKVSLRTTDQTDIRTGNV